MSNPDPLPLLRDCTSKKQPVILQDASGQPVESIADVTNIVLGTNTFPRETLSGIKKSKSDEAYQLIALIFLIRTSNLDSGAYFRKCREHNIQQVEIVHRAKILSYLEGKEDSLPKDIMVERPSEKRAREDISTESGKRAKISSANTKEMVQRVMERERPATAYNAIFQGKKNFSNFIPTASKLILGKEVGASTSKPAQPSSSGRPTPLATNKSQTKTPKLSSKDKIPIIIVPAAPTAMFRLLNIKQFLEGKIYEDAQKMQENGAKKPEKVTIEHEKKNGVTVPYHVVESASGFKQSDWDRVCCVIVTGEDWQFRNWKWEKPTDLFKNVLGFYPRWKGEKRKAGAVNWVVRDMDVDRSKRHNDAAVVTRFWEELDQHNEKHKPYLNY